MKSLKTWKEVFEDMDIFKLGLIFFVFVFAVTIIWCFFQIEIIEQNLLRNWCDVHGGTFVRGGIFTTDDCILYIPKKL
jgi:hypothetical protein